MTYLTLPEIHEALLAILVEFDRVCRENGLRYSLAYGTLLGAVRHKGFIPWDDDVDVVMPRPDYEKLYALGKEGAFREPFFLTEDRGKKAFYPFMKLLDGRYRIKSSSHIEVPNLYLDIFPVDGVPECNKKQRKKLYNKELFYGFVVTMNLWYVFSDRWWGYILRPFFFWFYPIWMCYGRARAVRKLRTLLLKYPFEECDMCDCRAWGRTMDDIPRSYYENLTEVEFEGHKFYAFAEYDRYLSVRYGNYMELPPVNKRQTHHIKTYRVETRRSQ